jgi:hypothetical protein
MLQPFGAKYHDRDDQRHGEEGCAHCGKPVRKPWRWFIEVIDGGAYVRRDHDPKMLERARCDWASYMGCFPVGPECRKVLEADGVAVEKWGLDDGPEPTHDDQII